MKFYNVIEFDDVEFFGNKITPPLKILQNLNKNPFSLLIFSELKKSSKLIHPDIF